MATGAEAIQAVAKVTGKLPATVGRAARALREGGQGLWPQAAAPGGGKNARHVWPNHLFNLSVALAVANPLTESAQQVNAFTSLVAQPATLTAQGQMVDTVAKWKRAVGAREELIIPGDTLIEAGAGLVDWISRPEGAELRLICTGMCIELRQEDGYDSSAILSYFQRGSKTKDGWANSGMYALPNPQSDDQVYTALVRAPGSMLRTTRLSFDLFKTLADLWSDTKSPF